ncbi:hypothetical protein MTR_3g027790 [Medicago truncatula]|uniref:Uncharacterized protein n=1 Tax=Medicago truncatula TaxID=3880 RepID=G7IWI9_MEDTR|nr:hypothetical protein MTR_3g027790 [Medicago truncatula]
MASLATALTATKAEFSNELTSMSGIAPRDANYPTLKTLNFCKTITERGFPLMVVCLMEGYSVEANKSIKFIFKYGLHKKSYKNYIFMNLKFKRTLTFQIDNGHLVHHNLIG